MGPRPFLTVSPLFPERAAERTGQPRDDAMWVTGIGLALVASAWLWLTGLRDDGGTPWATILVLSGSVSTVVVTRVMRGPAWIPPALVVASPLLVAATWQTGLTGEGPLGYENASATLYYISAAAALLVAIRSDGTAVRTAAAALAALWVVLVWLSGSHAAALLSVALLLCALAVRSRRALATLLIGGAVALAGALLTTVALAATHQPVPREGTVDRLVDATLGDLRVAVWHDALRVAREWPLTGVGVGRYPSYSAIVDDRPAGAHVHNEYLQSVAETGIVGAGLLLGLVGWGGWTVWRSRCPECGGIAAAAFIGVGLQATIDYVLHFTPVVVALAIVVGTGSSIVHSTEAHEKRRASPSHPGARRHLRAGGAYAALLCLLPLVPAGYLSPRPTVPNGAERATGISGVRFSASGMLVSDGSPTALYRRLVAARAVRIDLSVSPARKSQSGPARIVSSSVGPSLRNFTVAQEGNALVFRLRTTETDLNGSSDAVKVGNVFAGDERRRIVVTYDGARTRVYVDGRLRLDDVGPGGDFSNWNLTYPLLVGNEVGGQRPWLGTIHRLVIDEPSSTDGGRPRPTKEDAGREASVAYSFDEEGGTVRNRGATGDGADLRLAEYMTVDLGAFLPTFLALPTATTAAGWVLTFARWMAQVLLFAPLGLLAIRSGVARPLGRSAVPILVVPVALAGTGLEYLRFLEGQEPSFAMPLAAAVGWLVGAALGTGALTRHSGGTDGIPVVEERGQDA